MIDTPRPTILVVDDEPQSLDAIRRTLEEDFDVLLADSAEVAQAVLQAQGVDVVLCDQRMPGLSGVEFLKQVRQTWPDSVRIIISGYTDSEDIIAGVNEAGLYQYLLKPWMPDRLLQVVHEAVQARQLQQGIDRLDLDLRRGPAGLAAKRDEKMGQVRVAYAFDQLLRAPGSPMETVCEMAARFSVHNLSVLVLGESGTGKELLARAIHYASPRLEGPFVVENCAALADSLLESELFGHKRGSFTGAYADHVGLFQRAHGGTVFLDEIGEISALAQAKLLRVIEEREVRAVGSTRAVPVDVRLICATHRDLEAEVRAGRFREDLYYRIAECSLALPPLRERVDDLDLIVDRMLVDLSKALGKPPLQLDNAARGHLRSYGWPGNIRELRNEISRAIALSDGLAIMPDVLSPKLRHRGESTMAQASMALPPGVPTSGTLRERVDALERLVLHEVLQRHDGNKTQAAEELGISRVGLRAKLQRLGMGV